MDKAWSGCKAFIPKQLGSHVSCDWMHARNRLRYINRQTLRYICGFLSFETTRFTTTYDNICTAPHPETKKTEIFLI